MHTTDYIPAQQMLDKLVTLPDLRDRLGASEPLAELTFPVGDNLHFTVQPGWADGKSDDELSGAVLQTQNHQLNLTKKALLEAGAACGIPRKYQERLPATLLADQLNYWFREGWVPEDGGKKEREFKALVHGTLEGEDGTNPVALGLCRGTIVPFSNLQLLDIVAGKLTEQYGEGVQILADYKLHHDLEYTGYRLIVPGQSRVIENTRQPDDTWSLGIDIRNSLTGLKPPVIQGYMFRWWCTNGATHQLSSTQQFSRRGSHDDEDIWDWARDAVDQVLGGLEGAFESVQELTNIPVAGEVRLVLGDLFAQYNIPVRERNRIMQEMAELDGELTLYDIMQAITFAANAEGLPPRIVETLLSLGGHVSQAATIRCGPEHPCRRLMPEGWTPPALESATV